MIGGIYQRTRGMAQVSRRLFAPVREPGLGPAWISAIFDPFVLLENELARVVDLIVQTAAKPGGVRGSEHRIRSSTETPRFGHTTAERTWSAMWQPASTDDPRHGSAQIRRGELPAAEPTNLYQVGHGVASASIPAPGRGKPPALPQFTYGKRSTEQSEILPRSENGADRDGAAFPGQHSGRSSTINDISRAQNGIDTVWAADVEVFTNRKPSPPPRNPPDDAPRHESRLVQTSSLIHLLKRNTASAGDEELSSSAPGVFPGDAALQQPVLATSCPPRAVTVDRVLEELEDRLRFEFLRTYGSSGE